MEIVVERFENRRLSRKLKARRKVTFKGREHLVFSYLKCN
jgi:hypothetical protein